VSTRLVSIAELQDEYVKCRTIGHAWDDHPGAEFSPARWRAATGAMGLRCTRCKTVRLDYIAKDMSVEHDYDYPPGYHLAPGVGRRPNLRAELFRRSLLVKRYRDRGRRDGGA
jgi:hypothetical protein